MTIAVVTGARGGIGSVIVTTLREAGMTVHALDIEECDLRDDDAVRVALERVAAFDVLVHTAGVSRDGVVWKLDPDDWDFVQQVNLRSAFFLLRHAIPIMRARGGGRVVLIGSINGSRGKIGLSAYAASKAGLIGLAKSVARETGRFGICVNVVEPGWVRTALTDSRPEELREAARGETALGELVEPADVAATVAFLCGPGGRRITGQVIRVDAGQLIG